jgi:hypothetical protein
MYEQDASERSRSPGGPDESNVRSKVADVAETARHEAGTVADEVKHQAGRVASDLRGQLRHQAQARQEDAAERARHAAIELRDMANGRDPSPARTVVEQLADRSERLADYLSKHGPDEVLHEVQDFARRRPAAFLVSAAVAGFVVGRLTKGVVEDRMRSTKDDATGAGSTYRSAAATREFPPDEAPAFGAAAAPNVEPTYAAGVASVPAPIVAEPVPPAVVPPPRATPEPPMAPPTPPPAGGEPR